MSHESLRDFHHNQSVWLARLATGSGDPSGYDPRLHQHADASAIRTGESGVVMLPFERTTGESLAAFRALSAWLRQIPIADMLVWSMQRDAEIDLELLAQGFRSGFEPWWMTRDLSRPIAAPMHEISLITDADIEHLADSTIPYIVPAQLPLMRDLVRSTNEVIWLVARSGKTIIGQTILNITDDHAGIFNVGVDGRYRRRGIGTSLTNAALLLARDLGVRSVNLNSTGMGEHIYQKSGFRRIGEGMTWSISGRNAQQPVSVENYELARAIGAGETANVESLPLPTIFPNGMTPQELAAHFHQREMLQHLIALGQTPEIISLWDAGLREEALAATSNPAARELVTDTRRARPLHLATERGAGTLVLALIAAGADLHARDGEYRSTPLDWAHACNKPTIARIIRQAGGS